LQGFILFGEKESIQKVEGNFWEVSNMIDLFQALDEIRAIAIKTGQMQKEHLGRSGLQIDAKSTGIDLVTEIDKQSEEMIIEGIMQRYPGHRILAEETGLGGGQSDYLWIIDPLDGTTNYAQGLPIFAISIALEYQGETVLGVVYAPVLEQMFTAIKGHGAYLNDVRLQVSSKTEMIESVLATGFPYDIAEHPVNNINYFNEIVVKARAVRRMGAAAYDLACVAAGKFDGFWELRLSPWDVAAGILMVREAGGQILSFREDRGISIVAGNPVINKKMLEQINQVDKESAL
jgi:myo-inositol-1(or 4)-monophosphatase